MTVKAPLPSNETDRLKSLRQYNILDSLPEQAFDDLTRLAAQICQTPTALITLVDSDRQWFKSKVGVTASETPRDIAFCAHAILDHSLLIVPDACQDERFVENPLVTSDPKIRFYAGAPLVTPDNFTLGTLCLIDYVPRDLSSQQQESLRILARQVMTQLELRRNLAALKQVIHKCQQTEVALRESKERYRKLVELSPETIAVHSEGKFTYINKSGAKLLGANNPEEILDKPILDFVHPTYKEIIKARVQQIQERGSQTELFEQKLVRLDGQVIDVEATGIPVTYQGKPATQLVLIDITERKQAEAALQKAYNELEIRIEARTAELRKSNEQLRSEIADRQRAEEEVRLLQKITQAISESQNFQASLGVALRQVCEFTGWSFGEAWIPCFESKLLKLSPAWYGSSQSLENFRSLSKKFSFPFSTGLPGCVWSSRQPQWIPKLNSESSPFVRAQLASVAGFKAALGVPIVARPTPSSEPEVLAVLVFFMSESCEEDKRQVEIVSTVATQLGSLMQRKRVEEALREREALFRAVVEQTSEGIFLVDAQSKRILEANAAFARLLGYTLDEIQELTLYDIVALDRDIINRNVECVLGQKNYFIGEAPHRRRDGSITYAEVNVNVIFYGGREVFCIVAHDVTERKQVEEALRESEERLQAILDNSTALIYVKDFEGRYILVNDWYGILFHLDRQTIKGKTDYDIFPREIAEVFRANDKEVLESGTPLDWEEVFPHDDGLHTYLSVKFPLYNAAGVAYAVCGISTDITERKYAEEALRSSLATNRALIDAMPDLLFRISTDGTYVNYKASKDYDLLLPPNEFLGKKVHEVMPPEVAEPTMRCIQQALATSEVQIFEYQLMLHNELHYYEARIVVSAEDEVMAIVRDITDRKQAEAEICNALEKEKELSELKSRFVTMTSHEFRTPLTTILSSAELLEDYGSQWSEEKKLTHLRRIVLAVKHMTQLLNDVLLIGKAEAGKLQCSPSNFDAIQFCHDLVEEMQIITHSHTIIFNHQCEGRSVVLDEKLLRHILSNLLSNALKYSPQGGKVYFDLTCTQSVATFCVQDRGIGIPEAEQAQLFESFYRASNVGTISGTGLGLAIVKQAVDLHGGKIAVESEVGVGTKFVVSLPLDK
jgi:PAS domain S-box-containing protein